jgi:hypothetical protein
MASAAAARKKAGSWPFFLSKFTKKNTILSFFFRTLQRRPVPLQCCAAALVFSSYRCSASTPAALKRAGLRISKSAALRCTLKKVPIPEMQKGRLCQQILTQYGPQAHSKSLQNCAGLQECTCAVAQIACVTQLLSGQMLPKQFLPSWRELYWTLLAKKHPQHKHISCTLTQFWGYEHAGQLCLRSTSAKWLGFSSSNISLF